MRVLIAYGSKMGGTGGIAAAIANHKDWIAHETLAVELTASDGGGLSPAPVESMSFELAIERS